MPIRKLFIDNTEKADTALELEAERSDGICIRVFSLSDNGPPEQIVVLSVDDANELLCDLKAAVKVHTRFVEVGRAR
jgi:hypothetical protein